MPCPDENRLLLFVDHGLAPADRGEVASHLDGCSSCRAVVAGLVPSAAALTKTEVPKAAQPTPELPRALLRDYLRRDAPAREATAVTVAIGVQCVSVLLAVAIGLNDRAPLISVVVASVLLLPMPLQLILRSKLRRGWYRPWVSYVNASFETTLPMVTVLIIGVQVGAVSGLAAPAQMIWVGVVVFTALRSSPALSLVAGVVAAVETLILYMYFRPQIDPSVAHLVVFGPPGAALRAIFMLIAGVAGATLAWRQVRRAEQALHSVRMQDLMGKYVVHERIGRGGMGEVFKATYCPEGGFAKTVAVKQVLARIADDARFVEAFREEARLGALLAHPNVVQVLDFGRFEDSWVLALEYVDGLSLDALIHRGAALPTEAIVWLGMELCRGLQYIHEKRGAEGHPLGLVHRDLNPPNVLLSNIGEVKLGDFGVAAALDRRGEGGFAGKERWAAPEQLAGQPLEGRADLYALGLTLAAALSAGQPGAGRLRGLERADCPERLRALVKALLEPEKDRRPASAREVLERLSAVDDAASLRGRELLARAVQAARSAAPVAASGAALEETREMRGRTT